MRLLTAAVLMTGCVHAQNLSVDVGVGIEDRSSDTIYPYAGVSYPVAGCSVSAGLWVNYQMHYGPYLGLGCSWEPFTKEKE